MPYILNCQPGERIIADIDYQPSAKSQLFRFAVTNQAFFIPAIKFVVSGDARYFDRVPLEDIEELHVQPIKPYGFYFFAAVMAIVGFVVLYSMTLSGARVSARGLGYGAAFVVGGLLLPLVAKNRYRLIVRMRNRKCAKFTWDPPLVVESGAKRQVNEVIDTILQAGYELSLPIKDERQKMTRLISPVQ